MTVSKQVTSNFPGFMAELRRILLNATSIGPSEFDWVYTDEPHASRRKQILAKHPEVKKLMGIDPMFKYQVIGVVLLQIVLSYFARSMSWSYLIMYAWVFGGTFNHTLTLAVHEVGHNMAFGHSRPLSNRFFGMFAGLPIGVPFSVSFKRYHLEHHKYQGDREIDTDIPLPFEAALFRTSFGKLIWLLCMPFTYTLRPLIGRPKSPTLLELCNTVIQLSFDYAIYWAWGIKPLMYLLIGSFLSLGLHPISGHFISEHYVFVKGYETYSYYGILNKLVFNVGYHNEHHDFPNIPGSRLPQLKAMAPEFYDLPCHTSWVRVLYDFVTDSNVNLYSRVVRHPKFSGDMADKG